MSLDGRAGPGALGYVANFTAHDSTAASMALGHDRLAASLQRSIYEKRGVLNL